MPENRGVPTELTARDPTKLWLSRARSGVVCLALVVGAYKLGSVVHEHYPIHRWLFWFYAKAWLLAAWWAGAVLVFGHALLRWILGRVLPVREQFALASATGLFSFFLLMFLGGLAGLYGRVFFVALPLGMLAVGLKPAWRYASRLRRHLARARRAPRAPVPWWSFALLGLGGLCVVLLYIPILMPENVCFDARWYHLAMSEHYVAAGRVTRFPEGWFLGAYPQLSSYVYTWAFELPWSILFDRVEVAAHMELLIFLATLGSMPALVRRLVPGSRGRHAWVATFLFPGILLYDSNLATGADHIAAFWAVPIYLALMRAWRSLELRWCALLAMLLAGALNTKYSAAPLAIFPVAAVAVRAAMRLWAAARRRLSAVEARDVWAGPLAALGTGLVLTAPHWAKNWIWYGDPLYPMLHKHLTLRPMNAIAAQHFDIVRSGTWKPTRDWAGVKETLEALYRFSFDTHDWPVMHGTVPIFGSLFTLTVLCLPFLPRARRLWGLYAAGHLAVLAWFWLQHEDRYLQAFLPWMATAVAATIVLVWRLGLVPRIALAALAGLQIVWGGDVYFIPTHQMFHNSPIKAFADFVNSGYRKDYESRLQPYTHYYEMGKAIPRDAVLLFHEEQMHLGFRARSVQDFGSTVGGVDYGSLRSPRQVWDLLAGYGVTHVGWWNTSRFVSSWAADLVFYDFAERRVIERRTVAGANLGKLSALPAPDTPFGDVVAFFGCNDRYRSGLYHLADLQVLPSDPRPDAEHPAPFEPGVPDAERDRHLARADFVVLNGACHPAIGAPWSSELILLGTRGSAQMYVKRTSP
jgi:hypothetical protein